MFEFDMEQAVYEIGGVKVGGVLGETPTVMIGSIFFKGDKAVTDAEMGEFNRENAEERIRKAEELSDRTGLPAMLDVVCTTPQVAEKYLEFVADVTEMPLLVDAVSEDAAIKGMDCVKQLGVVDRTILNSVNPETSEQVYNKIREVGLEASILLTYSTRAIISSIERVKLVEPMVLNAKAAGIKKFLVDTVVMDVATLGLASKAIYEVKNQFGYPAGCGAHNVISSWKALRRKKDKTLTMSCSAVASGLTVALGADFVLYGPINEAEYMFPAIGMIDAAYGQLLLESGKRVSTTHPRFKIARF